MGFEIIEHTADLALRARGKDLKELIAQAAAGMIALLYTEPPPAPVAYQELTIRAEEPEFVLQRSLRELLYLLEDEGQAPVAVEVIAATPTEARLRVGIVPEEQVAEIRGALIKAVTRHGLQIAHEAEGLAVTIVFDV